MNNLKYFSEWYHLNENDREHSYGAVMLFLDPPNWKDVTGMVEKEDLHEEEGFGVEDEPHVTILYGLHDDIPDEEIEEAISKMTAPEITLENISIFENEDKPFDVVKFDIGGKELHKMNEMFAEFPHTTDFPEYHPHATIAYVKKGKGEKYVQKLSEKIVIKPIKIVYSKADDTKKNYSLNGA